MGSGHRLRRIVPFVGAALIVHRLVRRADSPGEASWLFQAKDTYHGVLSLLAEVTAVRSSFEAFQAILGKQWIDQFLFRALYYDESLKIRINKSNHIINYRMRFNREKNRTRIVQLLVERVTVGEDGIAVDLRHEGLGSVVQDMMAPRQTEACA
jgi:hypothetical protein